jgi:3D (Asp-Asp-Asp) domain-containing protein
MKSKLLFLDVLGILLIIWLYAGIEKDTRNFQSTSPSSDGEGAEAFGVKTPLAEAPSFIYIITAYCPCHICCGIYSDGATANGYIIQERDKFVAAPKRIPFGTIINIPGYGKVPVLDRGGTIKGNRLDVFFPTHQEALEWGIRELEVFIYE